MGENHISTIAEGVERILSPYWDMHNLMWDRLIEKHGASGWKVVSQELFYTMNVTAPLLKFVSDLSNKEHILEKEFSTWATVHALEEKDHANWLLEDLIHVGIDKNKIQIKGPSLPIRRLIGSQFALACTVTPFAILGYFYAFECRPSDKDKIAILANELGLPIDVFKTILYHCDVDTIHQIPIQSLLERVVVTFPQYYNSILESAVSAITEWTKLFATIASMETVEIETGC